MNSRPQGRKAKILRIRLKHALPFFMMVLGLSGLALFALNAEMGPSNNNLSKPDQEFLKKAAMGGMTEVALGKLAMEKSQSTDVKGFGRRMVVDHGKINADVATLAKKKGVELLAVLNEKHQAKVNQMSQMSGPTFDKAYLDEMNAMHEKDMAEFSRIRNTTTDSDLKAMLDRAIPIIKDHVEHLKEMPEVPKGQKQ
jgi:putative membrane protein